jgi:hypothetical protein
MNKMTHKQMVDGLMRAYVSWREACLRVTDAYDSWTSAARVGATSEFGLYLAALDDEERAADVYAGLVRRAVQFVPEPDRPGRGWLSRGVRARPMS